MKRTQMWSWLVLWPLLGPQVALAGSCRPSFLLPSQIADRIKASNVKYAIQKWDQRNASPDLFWRSEATPVTSPAIVPDPSPHVAEFPFDPNAIALLQRAEPLYQAGRCDEATSLYREALHVSPRCYLALLSLGDCALAGHDPAAALLFYKKAHEINPNDYIAFFYQGTALADLGSVPAARQAYIDALAMRPRHEPVLRAIEHRARELHVTVADQAFVPKVSVRAVNEGVEIGFDPDAGPQWLAYGLCKALWIGDPSHRKEMLGEAAHVWSSIEEEECLVSLLGVYATAREKGTVQPDPAVERLQRLVRDRLLEGFILYEIGSRVDPDLMLSAGEPQRRLVRDYIERYVVVGQPDA